MDYTTQPLDRVDLIATKTLTDQGIPASPNAIGNQVLAIYSANEGCFTPALVEYQLGVLPAGLQIKIPNPTLYSRIQRGLG